MRTSIQDILTGLRSMWFPGPLDIFAYIDTWQEKQRKNNTKCIANLGKQRNATKCWNHLQFLILWYRGFRAGYDSKISKSSTRVLF